MFWKGRYSSLSQWGWETERLAGSVRRLRYLGWQMREFRVEPED